MGERASTHGRRHMLGQVQFTAAIAVYACVASAFALLLMRAFLQKGAITAWMLQVSYWAISAGLVSAAVMPLATWGHRKFGKDAPSNAPT